MNRRIPRNRTGQRSGLYSESKFSNWSVFDPFQAEVALFCRKGQSPATAIQTRGVPCPIYERPLNAAFVRPFSADDVRILLQEAPSQFLEGLAHIVLLGGTAKQDRAAFGNAFRWGQYSRSRSAIYVFAYPRRALTLHGKRPPSPETMIELELATPDLKRTSTGWRIEFTLPGLRRFYLYDVLLHELGHHVDRARLGTKRSKELEYYAEWFAAQHGRRLRFHE